MPHSEPQRKRFKGYAWIPVERDLLDVQGAMLLLIGAREDPKVGVFMAARGIAMQLARRGVLRYGLVATLHQHLQPTKRWQCGCSGVATTPS